MTVNWQAPPNGMFGQGTWRVGSDIEPGLYRTLVEGEGFLDSCYWARLSGLTGDFDDIIANDNATGAVYVEILPTDLAFESGCGPWTKVE